MAAAEGGGSLIWPAAERGTLFALMLGGFFMLGASCGRKGSRFTYVLSRAGSVCPCCFETITLASLSEPPTLAASVRRHVPAPSPRRW